MKLLFLSAFALLISLTACSQAKSIEVIYTRAYKNFKDSSDIAPRLMENHKYRLYCSPTASRFEKIRRTMIGDDNAILYKAEQFSGYLYRDSDYGIHYKNTEEQVKLYQAKFTDSLFLIEENYNQYKWEFKDEKKKILGYQCYKAEGSYQEYSHIFKRVVTISVTVWYAPGIPHPFGPSGYDGLPGLVLEAYRASFYFIASKITFRPEIIAVITPPDKGERVNRKEFHDAIYRIYKNYTTRKKPKH